MRPKGLFILAASCFHDILIVTVSVVHRVIKLLFFNRQEKDILWRCELDKLAATVQRYPWRDGELMTNTVEEQRGGCGNERLLCVRFQVEYVLSEPGESWDGRRGHVDETLLRDSIQRPEDARCHVCVCGPTAFNDVAMG